MTIRYSLIRYQMGNNIDPETDTPTKVNMMILEITEIRKWEQKGLYSQDD